MTTYAVTPRAHMAISLVPVLGAMHWAQLNELNSYVSITATIEAQWSTWTPKSHVGADTLSATQLLLIATVFPLAQWTSSMQPAPSSGTSKLILSCAILALSFLALDLLVFFVLYEAVLAPLFIMILNGQMKATKVVAGHSLVMYTMIGSVPYLIAASYCMSTVGTMNMVTLGSTSFKTAEQYLLWPMLMVAMLVKLPSIPFHVWLPKAHTEAPTAGSMILAGIVLKLGAYGVLRVVLPLVPSAQVIYSPALDMLAIVSAIYGSLLTIRQVDLKRLVAFTSVAHMALMPAAVADGSGDCLLGAVLLLCSHGLIASLLFAVVGIWYDRCHSRIIRYARGTLGVLPLWTLSFSMGSLANASLPGTSSYAAELLLLSAIVHSSHSLGVWLCSTLLLSAVYSFWVLMRVSHGNYCFIASRPADMHWAEALVAAVLIVSVCSVGVYPMLVLTTVLSSWGLCHYLAWVAETRMAETISMKFTQSLTARRLETAGL
nr:NADH dehydrogenase subunit 4 [Rufusia pilicola]